MASLTPAKSDRYTSGAEPAHGPIMSLSAVIVDDEQLARDELAYLLKDSATSTS